MNPNTFWRDPALGTPRELELSGGPMRVFETGEGEPIVFVHGALVNANLWRKVVALLSDRHRCICLEMPLGSHELGLADADLSPYGLADLIAQAIGELELAAPTLVGNDTGGGLCQIAVSRHPGLVGRLFLTSCDAYDTFPPRFFQYVLAPLRVPALGRALFAPMRLRAARRLPIAYGWLQHTKLDPIVGDSYVLPLLTHKPAGQDLARVLSGLHPRYTNEAAEKLREFDRPTLIAWSRDDRFFPAADGQRLAAEIPGARFEWVDGARTFSSEDQPQRLAELIGGFVREP